MGKRNIIKRIRNWYNWIVIRRYEEFIIKRFKAKCERSKILSIEINHSHTYSFTIESNDSWITENNGVVTVISLDSFDKDYNFERLPNNKVKYFPSGIKSIHYK
jgi:hypothetical protein